MEALKAFLLGLLFGVGFSALLGFVIFLYGVLVH